MVGPVVVMPTGTEMDWLDMIRTGHRRRRGNKKAPSHVRSSFYDEPVPGTIATNPCDELDFIAKIVTPTRQMDTAGTHDPMVLSAVLAFSSQGRELPWPRSIGEDELWKQLKGAPERSPGKQVDAELEDAIPTFASIPDGKPTDPPEVIRKEDIRSGTNFW